MAKEKMMYTIMFCTWISAVALASGQDAAPVASPTAAPVPTSASGTVYTYTGLRQLEEDETVPDETKVKEWQAFVARATEQITYAQKAIVHWQNAKRTRWLLAVEAIDQDPKVAAIVKSARWQELLAQFPDGAHVEKAKERQAFWLREDLSQRIAAAEKIEAEQASKVARIHAWLNVLAWMGTDARKNAAEKRIQLLQQQLYREAENIDPIDRVDALTKQAVWQDVLDGRPTAEQRVKAEQRIRELATELQN